MRIYLESLGCRLNYAEMASLGRQLLGAGYELAASAAEADLCVLNSCTVTGEAARQTRQLARQMARANPSGRLVVTGCYATLEGEAVAALPNVALVVGNAHKDELLALISETATQQNDAKSSIPDAGHAAPQTSRTRAFVKAQDGCQNHCTFCIVSVARGAERSRPASEIVAEINLLHAQGYQEVVLTGVHLGGYGSDLGANLRALVEALLADTTIPRIRLSSLEPFDIAPDFFTIWSRSDGRLMPHLHLPAQSGSDTVLKRMARRNRVADYEALVEAARALIPDLTLTTDLIAGFPGETAAHFEQTLAFAWRVGFAHIHAFHYSPREGTAAARFSDQVPEAERRHRVRLLNEMDAHLGRAVRVASIGQTRPVLWESQGHPTGEMWSGLTDNYLRVLAWSPEGADLRNRITQVRLLRLEADALWGEVAPG